MWLMLLLFFILKIWHSMFSGGTFALLFFKCLQSCRYLCPGHKLDLSQVIILWNLTFLSTASRGASHSQTNEILDKASSKEAPSTFGSCLMSGGDLEKNTFFKLRVWTHDLHHMTKAMLNRGQNLYATDHTEVLVKAITMLLSSHSNLYGMMSPTPSVG